MRQWAHYSEPARVVCSHLCSVLRTNPGLRCSMQGYDGAANSWF